MKKLCQETEATLFMPHLHVSVHCLDIDHTKNFV